MDKLQKQTQGNYVARARVRKRFLGKVMSKQNLNKKTVYTTHIGRETAIGKKKKKKTKRTLVWSSQRSHLFATGTW